MANYAAQVKTRRGIETIEVEANNLEKAKMYASRYGTVMNIKKGRGNSLFDPKLTIVERQIFLQRFATMLRSRVGASAALDIIRTSFTGNISRIAAKMLKLMESGDDVMIALEKIGPPNFPENVLALIKAGSRSGEIWRAILDAVEFEREMIRVKKSSGNGVFMGVVGFLFAALVTLGTKFYFAPQMLNSQFFKGMGDKMDLTVIDLLTDITGYSMLLMFVVFVVLGFLSSIGKKIMPTTADKIIMKIPFYKDLILARNNYTILYGLSLLVKSGVSMEHALQLSANSAPKGSLKDDLARAVASVKKGQPWSSGMNTLHPTDKAALAISESKEQIANTLDALAFQYRENYGRVVASFGPTLQVVSALFLVLSGGILFGYTILPILQVAANGMN